MDEKQALLGAGSQAPPVIDGAPPPYTFQPQPSYVAPQVTGADRLDPYTMQKLDAVHHYGLYQGNVFGEAISCGCCANTYMITDRQRQTPVQGRGDLVETPLWIVQEESDCLCRVCCPQHPTMNKFYHALPPAEGRTVCGCCYTGHRYLPDKNLPVAMTLERDGCCNKWIGCCLCGPKCATEAWTHGGDPGSGKPGSIGNSHKNVIGRSVQPLDGWFTPKLDMYESISGSENEYAQLTGPCFFGGCLDLCVDTPFFINSVKGGAKGDLGMINKQAAKGCRDMFCQAASDADNYEVTLNQNMTPLQKANALGTAVHVDYWFFQRDVRPVRCYSSGDGKHGVIVITLCNMYCKGCLIPICISIPYGSK